RDAQERVALVLFGELEEEAREHRQRDEEGGARLLREDAGGAAADVEGEDEEQAQHEPRGLLGGVSAGLREVVELPERQEDHAADEREIGQVAAPDRQEEQRRGDEGREDPGKG